MSNSEVSYKPVDPRVQFLERALNAHACRKAVSLYAVQLGSTWLEDVSRWPEGGMGKMHKSFNQWTGSCRCTFRLRGWCPRDPRSNRWW